MAFAETFENLLLLLSPQNCSNFMQPCVFLFYYKNLDLLCLRKTLLNIEKIVAFNATNNVIFPAYQVSDI